jgi:hypothetical protein
MDIQAKRCPCLLVFSPPEELFQGSNGQKIGPINIKAYLFNGGARWKMSNQ